MTVAVDRSLITHTIEFMGQIRQSAQSVLSNQAASELAQRTLTRFRENHSPDDLEQDNYIWEFQKTKRALTEAMNALGKAQADYKTRVDQLSSAIAQLQVRVGTEESAFENSTQKVRALNPGALGEDRCNWSSHWRITNLCLMIFYFFYDLYHANTLSVCLKDRVQAQQKLHLSQLQLLLLQEFAKTMALFPPAQQPAQQQIEPIAAPVDAPPSDPFSNLIISEEQKRQLHYLLPLVATSGVANLIRNIRSLSAARAQLEPLHPLKSLELILKELKVHLVAIKTNPEKWNGRHIPLYGLVGGFCQSTAEKLGRYQDSILPCLPGFANSVGLTQTQEATLTALAQQGEWEQFVNEVAGF